MYHIYYIKYMKDSYNNIVLFRNVIIHVSPFIMYTIMLFKYMWSYNPVSIIEHFFIEWMISAPIVLISILNLKKRKYSITFYYQYYIL